MMPSSDAAVRKHQPWIDWPTMVVGAPMPVAHDRALVNHHPTSARARRAWIKSKQTFHMTVVDVGVSEVDTPSMESRRHPQRTVEVSSVDARSCREVSNRSPFNNSRSLGPLPDTAWRHSLRIPAGLLWLCFLGFFTHVFLFIIVYSFMDIKETKIWNATIWIVCKSSKN